LSLDLTKIAQAVGHMVARLKAGRQEKQRHLQYALNVIGNQAIDLEPLKRKIALSKTSWLVAGPVDGLGQRYQAPAAPDEFTILASDGSHIDVDRHRSTRCYLINIGGAHLDYGASPNAALNSHPHLYSADEDLVMTPVAGGRQQVIEGSLLGIKRSVEECRHLTGMAAELPSDRPALALLDGSLILWGLASLDYPEFVVSALLDKGFLNSLEQMKGISQDKNLALASYISFPGSTDVVNALRLAICRHEPADCDRYCDKIPCGKRDCDAVAGNRARELVLGFLGPGERSALFISQSSIVRKRYGDHREHFF